MFVLRGSLSLFWCLRSHCISFSAFFASWSFSYWYTVKISPLFCGSYNPIPLPTSLVVRICLWWFCHEPTLILHHQIYQSFISWLFCFTSWLEAEEAAFQSPDKVALYFHIQNSIKSSGIVYTVVHLRVKN